MTGDKTILITINTSWNIVNFRSSLIKALQEAGYRVISAAPEDAHTEALRALVDAHYTLPMQNDGTSPWHDAKLLWTYYRLFRCTRPDAVLAYTIKPNIYATLAASLLRIAVINNVSGLGTVFIKHNWLTRLARGLYRFAFRFSSCVFFQNAQDRQLFIDDKLVAESKAGLLPGSGIDLEAYQPARQPEKAAGQPCDFVLIARMLRDKGVEEYVRAARLVRAKYPGCRLRMVGPLSVKNKTAIDAQQMQQWAEEGCVEYWGERADIDAVITQHDCVVLPSYREGLSRVLLEASALGRPMVTTDVPGCRDVVQDGVNGLLCRPRDEEDLAAKMLGFIELSSEKKQEMARQSRHIAQQRFDEKQVHRAYLDQLASVL